MSKPAVLEVGACSLCSVTCAGIDNPDPNMNPKRDPAQIFTAGKYFGDSKRPWTHEGAKYDIALPCATQNEVSKSDAEVRDLAFGLGLE